MSYGFNLTGVKLPLNVPYVMLTLSDGTNTITYKLDYDDTEEPLYIAHLENDGYIVYGSEGDDDSLIISTLFTSEDVGDEYTINLSLPEEPTQSFSDAVHMVLGEEVLWEGDVSTTPAPISLSSAFGLTTICYIDGTPIQWQYVLDSSPAYIAPTNDQQTDYVAIILDGNSWYIGATSEHHAKVVTRSNKYAVIEALSRDGTNVTAFTTSYDVEEAIKLGYMLGMHIHNISDHTNSYGTVWAELADGSGIFGSSASCGGNNVTWTIDPSTKVLTGTFGGIDQ